MFPFREIIAAFLGHVADGGRNSKRGRSTTVQ